MHEPVSYRRIHGSCHCGNIRVTSTSEEIAKKAGLNERYVREWLGAMVTAEVVDLDSTSTRYSLPPEHAAHLTRRQVRTTSPAKRDEGSDAIRDDDLRTPHAIGVPIRCAYPPGRPD
jgi:hypothetical protein